MASSTTEPLVEVLKTPLNAQEDLDFLDQITLKDVKFVNKFETAWSQFLDQRPDLIPKAAKKQERLAALQERLQQARANQDAVQAELEQQVQFFKTSREALESLLATKTSQAVDQQREWHAELQSRLDTIAMADHLLSKTLPWQSFLKRLDQKLEQSSVEEQQQENHVAKPSRRAMALTERDGGAADRLLRAHRMDHALLSTNISMLQKEIERYDKTIESQELVGQFLTEHTVWSLLGDKSSSTGQSTTTGLTSKKTKSTKAESSVKK